MTYKEFSQNFDVLYNNSTSGLAPGLSEYEKSIFLTKAQNEIVKNYFNAKSNNKKEGFNDSPKREIDFSTLTTIHIYEKEINSRYVNDYDRLLVANRGIYFELPSDILAIVNEDFTVVPIELNALSDILHFSVIPIKPESYTILMSKPWQGPNKRQVWRMVHWVNEGSTDADPDNACIGQVEIILNSPLYNKLLKDSGKEFHIRYNVKYIKFPPPIITVTLTEGLTIQGKAEPATSTLPEELHEEIIQRAVEIAKNLWTGDLNTTIQLGQRSE